MSIKIQNIGRNIEKTFSEFQKSSAPERLTTQVRRKVDLISGYIKDMIEIDNMSDDIPETLSDQLESILTEWLTLLTQTALIPVLDDSGRIDIWIEKHFGSGGSHLHLYVQYTIFQQRVLMKQQEDSNNRASTLINELSTKVTDKLTNDYIKEYNNVANWNVVYAALWGVLSSVLIVFFFIQLTHFQVDFKIPKDTAPNLAQAYITNFTITRIFGLSVLIFVTSWCLKQFRTHRHLSTYNKNKAVALRSFAPFINTIDNLDIKGQVTLDIAKIIFDLGNTGYLATKDNNDLPSIINTIGSIKP